MGRFGQAISEGDQNPRTTADATIGVVRAAPLDLVHAKAGPGAFTYTALPADDIMGFPKVLGVTTCWTPEASGLSCREFGDQVTLVLEQDAYDAERHDSVGAQEGSFSFGTAALQESGWSGTIEPYLAGRPLTWRPSEPEPGAGKVVYSFRIYISADTAADIAVREQEHISDFSYAWHYSFGALNWALAQLSPQPSLDLALQNLVEILIGDGARYLIPAAPRDLASWGKRLRSVYTQLCEQSKKRDNNFEHEPRSYVLDVDEHERTITLQFQLKELKGNSAGYILPSQIDAEFTSDGFTPDARSAPIAVGGATDLLPGTRVTWDGPVKLDASFPESSCFETMDATGDAVMDGPAIHDQIADGVEVLQANGDDCVWVAVEMEDEKRYVSVRKSLLTSM